MFTCMCVLDGGGGKGRGVQGRLAVFSPCSGVSGRGGGEWRETQWVTVLRLVANLITPEPCFRSAVITPCTTSSYLTIPPQPLHRVV